MKNVTSFHANLNFILICPCIFSFRAWRTFQ